MEWPDDVKNSLRYITNSGGAMPKNTTKALRTSLPDTDIYLMYGLTEAFRSTYLPPELVDTRPDSIGKAIPNSEVLVVREDGTECTVNEPGELVHRGSLVALGYWNDPEKTHSRFKPAPGQTPEIPTTELAVWSGDKVRRDEDGYLYFVGRSDEMIKTSGYRVSPTEVEEVIYAIAGIGHAVALGARHPMLGQAIVLIAQTTNDAKVTKDQVLQHCKNELPNFMQPAHVDFVTDLPRNPNGKIDRAALKSRYDNLFEND
jgi:acyl-coenzyme A synthetase/AMP-(fatty) acid ligase